MKYRLPLMAEMVWQSVNEEVDLILLDLMLPGLNGIEVCRRIRSSE